MTTRRIFVIVFATLAWALVTTPASAQIPGVGSLPTSLDKGALLEQAKQLVSELTALKENPSLSPADKGKVESLLPKANSLNSELAKPQVEPSRLTQLATQLGDLRKQVGSLKAMIK